MAKIELDVTPLEAEALAAGRCEACGHLWALHELRDCCHDGSCELCACEELDDGSYGFSNGSTPRESGEPEAIAMAAAMRASKEEKNAAE